MTLINYWWIFEVKGDVIDFAETHIEVSGGEYKEVIKKIYNLQIPSLNRYDDIKEHLRLVSVTEYDEQEIDDEEIDDENHLVLDHGD